MQGIQPASLKDDELLNLCYMEFSEAGLPFELQKELLKRFARSQRINGNAFKTNDPRQLELF